MSGFFGDMFDFNHDGELDDFERVADFAMFTSLMEDEEKKRICGENRNSYYIYTKNEEDLIKKVNESINISTKVEVTSKLDTNTLSQIAFYFNFFCLDPQRLHFI